MDILGPDYFMRQAYNQALLAYEDGEVPIGCVVVYQDRIVGKTYNQTELLNDVTAHAEILAITSAEDFVGNKYLHDLDFYVTLEPCVMCAGALRWAQIGKLVYAASDEKNGFMRYGKELLHPKTKVEYGVMEEECSQLMKQFFEEKRKK